MPNCIQAALPCYETTPSASETTVCRGSSVASWIRRPLVKILKNDGALIIDFTRECLNSCGSEMKLRRQCCVLYNFHFPLSFYRCCNSDMNRHQICRQWPAATTAGHVTPNNDHAGVEGVWRLHRAACSQCAQVDLASDDVAYFCSRMYARSLY